MWINAQIVRDYTRNERCRSRFSGLDDYFHELENPKFKTRSSKEIPNDECRRSKSSGPSTFPVPLLLRISTFEFRILPRIFLRTLSKSENHLLSRHLFFQQSDFVR